jgi:hypothetical protein
VHPFCNLQSLTQTHAALVDLILGVLRHFQQISAISWRPVLVVEEAGVPEENHRPWASNR